MNVSDLSSTDLAARFLGDGLRLRTGPFTSQIRTSIPEVMEGIGLLYADCSVDDGGGFTDFHVAVSRPPNLRRWFRPQVFFQFDGQAPFLPLPLSQALPVFEWGLNWSITAHVNRYLIVHAAAIEKDGMAVIMPAPPGSGKSTLCAGLVNRGWRLLSDELTLLSMENGSVTPVARPISLKNESIAVIRSYVPGAVISRKAVDTAKGTVALLKAPTDSVARVHETAVPAWVIFPRFESGAPATLTARSKANTCLEVGRNAFNYSIHGAKGFEVLSDIIDSCDCYDFSYGDLDDAVSIFAELEPSF